MKAKKISCIILAVALIIAIFPVTVNAAARELIIDSVYIAPDGSGEIIGHYTNVSLDTQIAVIIGTPDLFDSNSQIIESNFNIDHLIWLGQVGTGNNGTFLIQFGVGDKWSEASGVIALGTSYGDYYTHPIEVPKFPPGLEVVSNNSVLYGRDIFYAHSYAYTVDNIATSLAQGGNNVYFMLGGNWYNLMSEDAVDNSFLVAKNASPIKEVEALRPRYYYSVSSQVSLRWR